MDTIGKTPCPLCDEGEVVQVCVDGVALLRCSRHPRCEYEMADPFPGTVDELLATLRPPEPVLAVSKVPVQQRLLLRSPKSSHRRYEASTKTRPTLVIWKHI